MGLEVIIRQYFSFRPNNTFNEIRKGRFLQFTIKKPKGSMTKLNTLYACSSVKYYLGTYFVDDDTKYESLNEKKTVPM